VERATYLRLFGHAMHMSDWRCIGYALMSNHIHLAMVAGSQPLATWAKRVHTPFSHWINRRFERFGHVFAHRPKDFAILPEDEPKLLAYVHNNPVAAKICSAPRESSWTSHRAYLGLAGCPDWLDVALGLARCGFADRESFDRWVCATPGDSGETDVSSIGRALARRGALAIATPTAGPAPAAPIVARPFAHVRPDPVRLVELVEEATRMPLARFCSRQRSNELVAARQVAVQAGRAMGLSSGDLATVMGLAPQSVARIARRGDPRSADAVATVLARMEREIAAKVAHGASR